MPETNIPTKQPRALRLLFFSELWERFGFYTINTILVLYLATALHMNDAGADLIYGTFSALIYLTPVAGGYLADRYLGFQRAILMGSVFYISGYLICALPNTQWLYLGLSLVILGNGFFKPNVSSLLGELYQKDDPRRVAGFTIFYMGINIGSLLPPLFIGAVAHHVSWNATFIIAAIGMAIGLLGFIFYRSMLGEHGLFPRKAHTKSNTLIKTKLSTKFLTYLTLSLIIAISLLYTAFSYPQITFYVLILTATAALLFVVAYLFKETHRLRKRMFAALILIVFSIGFWAVYLQTFSSMMLFSSRNLQLDFIGIHINAEFTQFFNPFFILAFSPFVSKLWLKLGKHNPSIPTKFAFGILFCALGYLTLSLAIKYFSANGLLSPWWLALSYAVTTLGELCLSPVGLAMITELSPKPLVGMMMGIWFLSMSAAFAIAGKLATLAAVPKGISPIISIFIYQKAFFHYGLMALALAIVAFIAAPFLKKLIRTK